MPSISPLPYTLNLPVASNYPSQDVNNMTSNTNSINSIWQTDHYAFGIINPGSHNKVQMSEVTSAGNGAIPPVLIGAGFETLYASLTSEGAYGNNGEFWFVRGATPTGIQLTGPGTPTKFSTTSGVTFMPGGIMLQWGTATFTNSPPGTQNFSFPVTFPTESSNIQVTSQASTFPANFAYSGNVINATTFSISVSSGVPINSSFFWWALGR